MCLVSDNNDLTEGHTQLGLGYSVISLIWFIEHRLRVYVCASRTESKLYSY